MILTGDIRGDGKQLSGYVLAMRENSHVEILEIDGSEEQDEACLHQTIMEMELNAGLTRTDKAFFHVQISPAYGEDCAMTREDWYQAADILAAETGYSDQRRVIVLHTKKDRVHAHVIWERYNHDTGKMVDNRHSILKIDAARPKIEKALGHTPTPRRNPDRTALKTAMTGIWNDTATGPEFMAATRKAGYMIAAGSGKRPFMVVDGQGRSFDLVRQIEGFRTRDIRARLRRETLISDKQAIDMMREKQAESSGARETLQTLPQSTAQMAAESFAENRADAAKEDAAEVYKAKIEKTFDEFKAAGNEIAPSQPVIIHDRLRKEEVASQFADNGLSGKTPLDDRETEKQKIIAEQERIRQRRRTRKPGR